MTRPKKPRRPLGSWSTTCKPWIYFYDSWNNIGSEINTTQLLDRCITRCEEQTGTIAKVVGKMERYLTNRKFVGKVYAALKDAEIKALLAELDQAQGTLELAIAI
jgi:hypothetical protein